MCSSSTTKMPEWLYLCAGNKKPLHLRGYGFVASPLISRNYPAGIGTLSCDIAGGLPGFIGPFRSEEHTSELQSQSNLVCRLLLEKKKKQKKMIVSCNMTSI